MMTEQLLILNIAGIGDFVDSTAALRALRRAKRDARITMVVAEKVLPLASACPFVNEVIGLPTAPGRGVPYVKDLPRWLRLVYPLRNRFSVVVNLYEVGTTRGSWWLRGLLAWLNLSMSIGQEAKGCARLYTRSLPVDQRPRDNVACNLAVISLIPGILFPR